MVRKKVDIIFSGFHGEMEYRFTLKDQERENDKPIEEDYIFAQNVTPFPLEFH